MEDRQRSLLRKNLKKFGVYAFLLVMTLVFIGPMYFAVISSVKDNKAIFRSPFGLPEQLIYNNYLVAWTQGRMGQYFLNSVFISSSTIIVLAIAASMTAFVLAKFNFKANRFLQMFFLMGMMVPIHTVLVPVAYIVGKFNLKNNLFTLVFIYAAFSLPFSIAVLTVFVGSINNALIEAAIIDGAGHFQIYRYIILPMSVPAISTISIFNFLTSWNDIIFPLIIINDNRLKPISLGLLNFHGERGSDYGPLMAAIVITSIIPVILYILFQEKVETGIAAGAIKE